MIQNGSLLAKRKRAGSGSCERCSRGNATGGEGVHVQLFLIMQQNEDRGYISRNVVSHTMRAEQYRLLRLSCEHASAPMSRKMQTFW